ncbi:HAD family hydrolase [Geminocystis sp. CENA526]|uniref:HAD family hydrolase n=1 Tax=Geminocystis sp. CENA526 TaxID=1355871 RepID=UPI003D6E5A1D
MGLKAILFDFNGVIINDNKIHKQLIDDILLKENLRPSEGEYYDICLRNIFAQKGRILEEKYLKKLLENKAQAYYDVVSQMPELPIFDKIIQFILSLQTRNLPLAIVTDTLRQEVEYILERINVKQYFPVIVTADDIKTSKPSPEGYLLAMTKLNEYNPDLCLQPSNCLVIEDTPIGIKAGKNAGMSVVGIANTYPFHMIQRQANWCVDHPLELDLDWIDRTLENTSFVVE